jgi:GMP synthase (glutamine-hydrolysing)
MGACDDLHHPHLIRERRLLADAVRLGKPVLGVCLGAQLLAAALGAIVVRGPEHEIGFGEVELTPAGLEDPILGPEGRRLPVFNWHHDTFDLPSGAVNLASSPLYQRQAFRVGERAYGLQFHIELNDRAIEAIRPELPPGVRLDQAAQAEVASAGRRVFGRWWDEVSA